MIFPGLGTVGGALAGWIGGKGYGDKRKEREERRDRSQYSWEEKWGKPHGYEKERARGEYAYGDEKDAYGYGNERRRSSDDDGRRRREKY